MEYYTLAPLPRSAPVAAVQPQITIAVRPVALPDLLDRPQIVVRTRETTVSVSDFQRWAGTLRKDFSRVLVENLNILLQDLPAAAATDDIALDPDFIVAVHVNRFDGRPEGALVLSALWSIKHSKGTPEMAVRKSLIEERSEAPGYEGLVAAHSRAVAALSREIAAEIRRMQK
ncbi:MAG: PqiC family protein [Desulfobacterales bacterium]|nr:PqiC family protein [Desulfobacterales bacterium]